MPALASPCAKLDFALVFRIGELRSLVGLPQKIHTTLKSVGSVSPQPISNSARALHDAPQGPHFDRVPQRGAGTMQFCDPDVSRGDVGFPQGGPDALLARLGILLTLTKATKSQWSV